MKTLNGNSWFQTLGRFMDCVHFLSTAAACETPHELDFHARIRRTPIGLNFEIRPKTIANAHRKLSKPSEAEDSGQLHFADAGSLVSHRANYQLCTFAGEIYWWGISF
ncbi:MAG: hypothetical protein WA510_31125 [Acidobacteriaceae bacterium]